MFSVRRFFPAVIFTFLLFALHPCFGQKTNKPTYTYAEPEKLHEKDNSFAGSGTGKHKFFSRGIFGPKRGSDHVKTTQHFRASGKASRSAFQKKQYGKKGLFGRRKSNGWGGKAFKTNGQEDKRLFKGQKKRKK